MVERQAHNLGVTGSNPVGPIHLKSDNNYSRKEHDHETET